jgi:hypothetical protein
MFSLEIRANGKLLGCAYVENKLRLDNGDYLYYVEYHRMGLKPNIIEFSVAYNRDEGAEGLTLLIFKELDKRLKIEMTKEKQ